MHIRTILNGYQMPHFKQIPQIQQLMSNKELIRNIGIIAHIDHGKTTLADSLLAGTGLLSPRMAGTARVLDYLEEEQKRKITIKTANISLLYKTDRNPFLINLVDTPGHVDFTGKVTRALRVIDGAVVIVDAVEEIMAQTEILTKQALQERVHPVLFINKVDRLIVELQLNEEQIQKKLNHIIGSFNDLIELYADASFKRQWKIDASASNLAFGSALHGWGFTLNMIKRRGVKFSEIIKAYQEGTQIQLQRNLPVSEAIFQMAIEALPNPRKAQSYRVEKIWAGHTDSKVGRALIACRDDGPTVTFITNVHSETDGNAIATGRIFSGKIKVGDKLHLVDALTETEVKQVSIDMGSFREEVTEVSAGNLTSLTLSGQVKIGETIVDIPHKAGMVPFEGTYYLSEAVITLAVEPKNPQDLPLLILGLEKLTAEDPNLKIDVDKETGEYLLSGMGQLHLEIAINQLKDACGIDVVVSSPRVVYKETVSKKGVVALAKSPNKLNCFWLQVEPEAEEQAAPLEAEELGNILSIDENRNVLLDCRKKPDRVSDEVLEALIAGFEYACKAGPLCGEPIRHLQVKLIDMKLEEESALSEVMHGASKAIFGSFLTAQPTLFEPIYKITITVATELSGESSRILSTRRGKITQFEQKGMLTHITGFIPVSETFGFSKELRSATSGRAFWQSFFDHWEKMPQKLTTYVINDLRQRKGLAPKVPKPEKFMEPQ
jgi:elongation factor 2